jgi:hypothetical protein
MACTSSVPGRAEGVALIVWLRRPNFRAFITYA